MICELGSSTMLQHLSNFISKPTVLLKFLCFWIRRSLHALIPPWRQIFLQLRNSNLTLRPCPAHYLLPPRTHNLLPIFNKILLPKSLRVHPSQCWCSMPLMGHKILISSICNGRSDQSTLVGWPAQVQGLNSLDPINPIASILVVQHLLLLQPCFPWGKRKGLDAKFHKGLSRLDVDRCLEELIDALVSPVYILVVLGH